MIQIVPARPDHVAQLAPRLRKGDRDELDLSGMTPEAAITRALQHSTEAWAAILDGKVIALWGLGVTSIVCANAWTWLMTADGVERHRLALMKHARAWLAEKGQIWRMIDAAADPRYEGAVKLLTWLGFKDEGPDGNPGLVRFRRS